MIQNRPQTFLNTNRLVRSGDMDIGLQKTGLGMTAKELDERRDALADLAADIWHF
jgi:hypothetical protein